MINEEEKQFLKTLSRGRRMFERTLIKLQSDVIPGEVLTSNVLLLQSEIVTINPLHYRVK